MHARTHACTYACTHTHICFTAVWTLSGIIQWDGTRTSLDFTEARDKWVAVASAGPYANLHLTPYR